MYIPVFVVASNLILVYPLQFSSILFVQFDSRLPMKFLNDNILYEFTVAQDDAVHPDAADVLHHRNVGPPYSFYHVNLRHCQLRLQQRAVVSDHPLYLPYDNDSERNRQLILPVLIQLEVPPQITENMAEHFGFCIERLKRRYRRNDSTFLSVLVCLNVKEITLERAAAAQSRIASGRATAAAAAAATIERRERESEGGVVDGGRRWSVEDLEKVMIDDDRYQGEDCPICLEKFKIGSEVVKMPCLHLFHKGCIAKWLAITCFCPFCRSQLS